MLAGCSSSTLLSPSRHRLKSESPSSQFQSCHFQLPSSMNTHRLDLPCSFSRKDSSRPQPIRPLSISVEKPIDPTPTGWPRSLKQHTRLPPLAIAGQASESSTFVGVRQEAEAGDFWDQGKKGLKRFAEQGSFDELYIGRAKRKKSGNCGERYKSDGSGETDKNFSFGQLVKGSYWFQQSLDMSPIPFAINCSGDEERVCFAPGELVSPPLLSRNPWVQSVVAGIADYGEKENDCDEETSQGTTKEASGTSISSESESLALRLKQNASENEGGNGSGNPFPHEGTGKEAGEADNELNHHGFELVSLLMACVEAMGLKNVPATNHFIAKLGNLASPWGPAVSRLIAYYTEALALRTTRLWPHIFHLNVPREFDRFDEDTGMALRLFNQVSPIPKFIHFTANEILLKAFDGKDRVHIIDFDIKQGLQWPGLFQSLASRSDPPSHVRITGIGESKQELIETGDRLAGFAGELNLPFEFHPVVDRLEDVRLWMLHLKEGECVAVNCTLQLHKTLYDGTGGMLRDFLGVIRSTNPIILVTAEQEASHNTLSLELRAINSLRYYSALFDLIDTSLPRESIARNKIEEMFGREIRDIVACEGSERFERHEEFSTWRKLIEEGGEFRCTEAITEREKLQGQMLLKMYGDTDYSIVEQEGRGEDRAAALTMKWQDQPLYTVSAWEPANLAGGRSSPSFSQQD
ncbi:hypothetical protein MLD38_027797 [Melastoma candidum]|uniref:Uncharacterized protein n=1 Tax=Melastoma candidum TaxID=119954 RepID=A0ACB9P5X2_9MYRT|nr:hypothetical protein MLD38_027797 [Melastoma candidum]